MEPQTIINALLLGASGVGGWFAKTIYSAIKALENDLAQHKVEVARDYATNTDIRDINQKLDDILRYLRK